MKTLFTAIIALFVTVAGFAQSTESPTSVSATPSRPGRSNYTINTDGSITTAVRTAGGIAKRTIAVGGITKVNNIAPDSTGNVRVGSDAVTEGSTNLFFLPSRVTTVGDARYPQVGSVYNNPSWIGNLAAAKITGLAIVATTGAFSDLTGKPTSITGYGIADADPYTSVATYAAMNALTFAASTGRRVLVATDEQYGDTNSWYMVWADSGGTMHAKRLVTITEK